MPELFSPRLLIFSTIAACLLPANSQAVQPQEFEAVYDVYMNGKLRMETRVTLTREGGEWEMRNEGKGVKGLARFLRARNSETGRVLWTEGTVQPLSYTHHSKVAGRDKRWSAAFDRDRGVIETEHEEGQSSLPLAAGTMDPLSLTLALRESLDRDEPQWRVKVVDEDEIDEHLYAAGESETLQTALGCFEVVPLERVRENSNRYSNGWYAPDLDFFPVRARHGKRGDSDFDMRIRQLTLAGEVVEARPDCS